MPNPSPRGPEGQTIRLVEEARLHLVLAGAADEAEAEERAVAGFTFERVVETYMDAYRWVTGRE